MSNETPVIELNGLTRRYGKLEAVNGLNLTVRAGRCYGFFGRNGAGKTTTIKCLLNLLRPTAGTVRVFGLDPEKEEVAVKSRLAYVPDAVAFYPWMTVRDTLDYLASFRAHWNRELESNLLQLFQLDPLADEREERCVINLEVMCHDHSLVDFLHQQLLPDLLGERRAVLFEEAAFAGEGLDDALALEFGVCFGDGIAIDAQFLRQRPDGRERLARTERPGRGGVADLIHQLKINRLAGLEIDLKHHKD